MRQKNVLNRYAILISVIVVVLVLTFIGGCKDDVSFTNSNGGWRGSLSDPSIIPAVIYTLPAANSSGPFSIYNAGDGVTRPHFVIQFNKFINDNVLPSGAITCEGFDVPAVVLKQRSNAPPKTNSFTDILSFEITNGYYSAERLTYAVGKTYRISVDTNLEDVNGNHPRQKYSFSFVPEPYFRVVGVFPPNGANEVIPSGSSVQPRITFNSKVAQSILGQIQITPAVSGRWRISSYDSTRVYFYPDSAFAYGTSYTINVSQNAADKYGNRMYYEHRSSFATSPFTILSTSPTSGSIIAGLSSSVRFYFSGPLDTSTLRTNFSISPSINGALELYYYEPNSVVFTPTFGWIGSRQYTVTFSTGLRATNGTPLDTQKAFVFSTAPFMVQSTYPPDGETNVSMTQRINVTFNGPILSSSVQSAFRISPNVVGSIFPYSGSNSFEFAPMFALAAGTTYTVTVDTSLRTPSGNKLASPYTFSFTTQPFRVNSSSPAIGDTNVSGSTSVYFSFNAPIDTGSVRSAFSISPSVVGTFSMYQGNSYFYFYPTGGYRSGVRYTVTLSSQMRSAAGSPLGSQYQFWFRTIPFSVTYNYPMNGATGVSRSATVDVYFTNPLNLVSVANAFRISPPVNGYFSNHDTHIHFYPTASMSANTGYTVTISTAIRSTSGDSLSVPYLFSFVTGP